MSWQSDLENDLDWRFAELAALRFQAANTPPGSTVQRALLRALWAMLYAHYEGFCKTAIRIYLKEIRSGNVRRQECKEMLAVFSLQKVLRNTKGFAAEACWQFYSTTLPQALQDAIDYELDKDGEILLEGESNLYPTLLRTNLQHVGLPHVEVDAQELRLGQLVGRRNSIAHGKKLIIHDLPTYQDYENAASEVMYGIAFAVIGALEGKTYLRAVRYEG